jgi:hypothetical protein
MQRRHHRLHPHEVPLCSLFVYLPRTAGRMSPLSGARERAVGVDLVFGSWNYSHACSGCCRATHRHSKTHWLRTLVVMELTAAIQSAHLPCWPSYLFHRTDASSPRPTGLRKMAQVPSRGRSAHRQPQLLARRRITNARLQPGDGSAQHTGSTLPRTLLHKVCVRAAPLLARSLTSHEDGPNPRLVLKPSRASFTGHQTMARVPSPG